MEQQAAGDGLGVSLRRLLGTLLEMGQTRLELLGTEIELEKQRIFDALLWGACGLVLLGVGLLLLAALLLLVLQDAHRLPALAAMVLLAVGGGAWLIAAARRRLQGAAVLFASSAAEFERDRAALQPRD
jgi:uncharacterized membrane protein YqjE